jgi:aminoglycoside phosphotransferase (APT) family kinase protein
MISQWKAFLQEKVAEWNLPPDGKWNFLFLNVYHPDGCNLDVLWFHDAGEFPLVVTKLCRDERILRWEFENLTRVHSCAPVWTPKPLSFEHQAGFWALWMEGVPGSTYLSPECPPAVLTSIVEMLAALHGAIRDRGDWPSKDRCRRMVWEPLESLERFSKVASVEAGCAKLRASISAEWVDSLPIVPQHGDLFQGNLLSHGNQWRVVDWENFGRVDFPFFDLLTLLFSILRARGETPETWDPVLVKQVPSLIEFYTQKMGLSSADVTRLLPLALANWFYLQRLDRHAQLADNIHKTIQNYFEHAHLWEKVFVPSCPPA